MDFWVVSHLLAIVKNAAMNLGAQIFVESLLSIRLSIYPGVELLGRMIILCFQKNISLFTAVLGLSCSTRGWGGLHCGLSAP